MYPSVLCRVRYDIFFATFSVVIGIAVRLLELRAENVPSRDTEVRVTATDISRHNRVVFTTDAIQQQQEPPEKGNSVPSSLRNIAIWESELGYWSSLAGILFRQVSRTRVFAAFDFAKNALDGSTDIGNEVRLR